MGGVFAAPSFGGSQLLVTLVAWYLTLSSEHNSNNSNNTHAHIHVVRSQAAQLSKNEFDLYYRIISGGYIKASIPREIVKPVSVCPEKSSCP